MTERFEVAESRPAVSYGPVPDSDQWVLGLSTTDGERVEIVVGERAMYDLWIEVRGVPWPSGDRKGDRLVRQVVHAANGADNEMLEDALRALGVGQPSRDDELRQYRRWLVVELAEEFDLTHHEIAEFVPHSPEWVSQTIREETEGRYERRDAPGPADRRDPRGVREGFPDSRSGADRRL